MILTALQITELEDQLTARVIPDGDDLMTELRRVFGDHTFFVDADGLHVVEWFAEDQTAGDGDTLTAVRVAAWTDDTRTAVAPHEPTKTEKTVQTAEAAED